jgi:hypothetical protein
MSASHRRPVTAVWTILSSWLAGVTFELHPPAVSGVLLGAGRGSAACWADIDQGSQEAGMGAAQAQRVVVCRLDHQRFALPVAAIDRVLPAMAYRPSNHPQAWLSGTVDVHGDTVPVLDIRRRLGCDPREPQPGDMFVLATSRGRRVGFFVDAVEDVVDGFGAVPLHDLERLFPMEASPT